MTIADIKDQKLRNNFSLIGALIIALGFAVAWVYSQSQSFLLSAAFLDSYMNSFLISLFLTSALVIAGAHVKDKSKWMLLSIPCVAFMLFVDGYTVLNQQAKTKIQTTDFSLMSDDTYRALNEDYETKKQSLGFAQDQLVVLNNTASEIRKNHHLESFNCETEKRGKAINRCKTAEDKIKEKKLKRNDNLITMQNSLIKESKKALEEATKNRNKRADIIKEKEADFVSGSYGNYYSWWLAWQYSLIACLSLPVFLNFLSTANSLKRKNVQLVEQLQSMSRASVEQYATASKQLTASDYLKELKLEIFNQTLFSTAITQVWKKYEGSLTREQVKACFEYGVKVGTLSVSTDKAGRKFYSWAEKSNEASNQPILRSVSNA